MFSRTFFIHSLIIVLLLCRAASICPAQQPTADKNVLAKFEKSIEAGDYAAIERDLLNYAIANPKDAKVFELLARLRFNQNRLSEAKSLYQKVLSLDPNFVSAKITLAVINYQTGNAVQSVAELVEISEKNVLDGKLQLELAQAFALTGDCRMALTTIEKRSVEVKNNEALPLRAKCYLETGEKQKIEPLIVLAKNLLKTNPQIPINFAEILLNGGMFNESADVSRRIVKTFPQNIEALLLLAKAEINLKDFPSAETHLGQASKINATSADLLFVRALLEGERGNHLAALETLEKLLETESESPKILKRYVITAMRASYAGKAVKAAAKLINLQPDEPEFLYLYGAASLQNNNLEAAENSLTRFLEIRPNDSLGCVALGLTFASQADKILDARRQMQKCLEINPNNFEAKYQLGLSYKTQGETAKAIEHLEAAVKDAPDYALALRDLGASYLQAGAESKARIVLEKSLALDPDDTDTHFLLSRLYNLIGEAELAKKHLEIFQKLKNPKRNGM